MKTDQNNSIILKIKQNDLISVRIHCLHLIEIEIVSTGQHIC